MFTAFDPLAIAVALLIMAVGFSRRWSCWRMGRDEARQGDLGGLVRYIFGHGRILGNRPTGIAHLVLFWGLVVPLGIVVLAQFHPVLPMAAAKGLSLLLDIVGIAALAATLFFLARRLRSAEPRPTYRTVFPLALILLILITGFLAAGTRISILGRGFSWYSPAGSLVSLALPSSPMLMQVFIRVHFLLVLLLIAASPFTFMRHVPAGLLNVYYRGRGSPGRMRGLDLEGGAVGPRTIQDLTWKQLLEAEACVSCGRCDENCPATVSGKPLSPKKIMGDILEQMDRAAGPDDPAAAPLGDLITAEEVWSCTTCMACVEHCPVLVEPVDKVLEMRRYQVLGKGRLPPEARPMLRDLEIFRDVYGKGPARREEWALNLEVPHISREGLNPELLLWVGCSGAFHPRYRQVTRALVKILGKAGVPFGTLGREERCCGDAARRLGSEDLFKELALQNIALFKKYGVGRIITLCPHGFNTFKNEYPALGGDFEVVHATEFVLGLVQKKRLTLKYPLSRKVAVHDPCYLGRANGIYEPPRELIRSIPGVAPVELGRTRASAFCCGGGGGRMWLRESAGEKINNLRAREIGESGIELVGTACPFCLTMLEDGMGSLDMERPPRVMDIIEIVASSLEETF